MIGFSNINDKFNPNNEIDGINFFKIKGKNNYENGSSYYLYLNNGKLYHDDNFYRENYYNNRINTINDTIKIIYNQFENFISFELNDIDLGNFFSYLAKVLLLKM
jgi:hypothetical protein